jgi:hypothetical protein
MPCQSGKQEASLIGSVQSAAKEYDGKDFHRTLRTELIRTIDGH